VPLPASAHTRRGRVVGLVRLMTVGLVLAHVCVSQNTPSSSQSSRHAAASPCAHGHDRHSKLPILHHPQTTATTTVAFVAALPHILHMHAFGSRAKCRASTTRMLIPGSRHEGARTYMLRGWRLGRGRGGGEGGGGRGVLGGGDGRGAVHSQPGATTTALRMSRIDPRSFAAGVYIVRMNI
jgi:hypothetical protein